MDVTYKDVQKIVDRAIFDRKQQLSVHIKLLALGAIVPGAHSVWDVDPVEQNDPSGQSVHAVSA